MSRVYCVSGEHSARRVVINIAMQKETGRKFPFIPTSSRPMTKDTAKALVIIIAALTVLVMLLFWANHLRPHG
jgi:hypothetical protein